MPVANLTKSFVERAPADAVHWDESLKGFGLRVTGHGTKTWVVQKSGRGMKTIGRYPAVTVTEAREAARLIMLRASLPELMPARERWDQITLREALQRHEAAMIKKERSPKSIWGMWDEANRYLSDWLDRPLAGITKLECCERHEKITKKGPYSANRTMRIVRAAYNRARKTHNLPPENPVIGVEWNKEHRRQEPIPADKLADWAKQVTALRNPVRRDYQLIVLLTGLRRTDAATLRWEHVDLERATLHRPRPKGGVDRAFTIPLPTQAVEILRRRRKVTHGDWVFPAHSRKGRSHIKEPKEDGLPSMHRLRDTWATAAAECGVDALATKILLNHSLGRDITEGYQKPGPEATRTQAQKVADWLWNKAALAGWHGSSL